jgi:Htaa protein
MSSNRSSKGRVGRTLVALAALALAIPMASSGSALAAPASGEVSLSLRTNAAKRIAGKAGKGGAVNVTLPIVDLAMPASATVRTGETLKLSGKGRDARLRGLILQVAGKHTAISAKLGKRRLVVFRAEGEPSIDATSLTLKGAQLTLTDKGADALGARLGLDGLSAGRLGTLAIDARLDPSPPPPVATGSDVKQSGPPGDGPPVDPYAQQCALKVKSKAVGSAAGPAPAPALSSPTALSGGKIDWGFSGDLRFYVVEISGGSLVPIAPAEVLNPPLPAPQIGPFRFPAGSGELAINDPDNDGDDQAIVNGQGEIVLCNSPHGFRVTLSHPAVTIDGADSRLTVDVDTNMSGVWTPTQRVDLATLDLDGTVPFYNENAKSVTWADLPVSLTAAGAQALRLCDPHIPGPCDYEEGDPLDPLSLTTNTASGVAWPFNAACTLGSPATASAWPAVPAAPQALPTLSSPSAVSSGAINWGVRNSLRNTVQSAPGVFNLSGGATRSDAVDMSGAGKFFTWPASGGEYEAGSPARLVLHGTGAVGLCNTAHGFGTVLSSPTLTIDGANSRLTMDVATRIGVSWTSGRVDIASLATTGMQVNTAPGPGAGEETVTWTFPDPGADNAPGGGDDDSDSANSAVKLTAAGGSALALIGIKNAGTALNRVTVSIVHPTS